MASATCIASSRVGTSTSPRVRAPAAPAPALVQQLDHRQRERGRLARAGRRLRDQVIPSLKGSVV
jgi:hypothetical protein